VWKVVFIIFVAHDEISVPRLKVREIYKNIYFLLFILLCILDIYADFSA